MVRLLHARASRVRAFDTTGESCLEPSYKVVSLFMRRLAENLPRRGPDGVQERAAGEGKGCTVSCPALLCAALLWALDERGRDSHTFSRALTSVMIAFQGQSHTHRPGVQPGTFPLNTAPRDKFRVHQSFNDGTYFSAVESVP